MRFVLVSLPGGEGVVRCADGDIVVSDDVAEGEGTYVCEEDPYHPVKSWVDADRSVVGGLLPPGAVSAEVVDDRGRHVSAAVGGGAYAAIIEQSNDHEPIVCCRDAAGRPVRRPLPAEYPSTPVTDTDQPCPACGAVDYGEYAPTEEWRGGSPGPNGRTIPNPIVVCRVCGQEEPEWTFYAFIARPEDDEDNAVRQAQIARVRAEMSVERWYSNAMTLRAVMFPIYAAEGWPAEIGGSGSRGDQLTEITIRHHDTPEADVDAARRPRLEITTSQDECQVEDELDRARETLELWRNNADAYSSWPAASQAAITLWLAARERECRAIVLAAERAEQLITIDGIPEPFFTLTASTLDWVAVRRHQDLTITIAGRDLDPTTLTIEPIADPAARLLGPRPDDP